MAQAKDKNARRNAREDTIKSLNVLASELDVKSVALRAPPEDIQELFRRLCLKVPAETIDRLDDLWDEWVHNGGCALDE